MSFGACTSCGAGVIWCRMPAGEVVALDAAPCKDGDWTITHYAARGDWSRMRRWDDDIDPAVNNQRYRKHRDRTDR